MAKSPSHELGEYLGWFIENMMIFEIQPVADELGLYLDHEHLRKARNGNKKVRWFDKHQNHHDLDIVLEKDGTDEKVGSPVAFIEMAWRRYTKHSKNKAQEISDSIMSVGELNQKFKTFYSTVLAGEFTKSSITQIKSRGFKVLYFSYSDVCKAFDKAVGVNIYFDEKTPEKQLQSIYNKLKVLSDDEVGLVRSELINLCKDDFDDFIKKLKSSVERKILKIFVIPEFENRSPFFQVNDAVKFLKNLDLDLEKSNSNYAKIRIEIEFSNGDKTYGEFSSKENAIDFINKS